MEDIFKNVKLKSADTKDEILKFINNFQEHNNENSINIDLGDVKTTLDPKGKVALYTSEQVGSKPVLDSILKKILPVTKLNAALFLFEISDKYEFGSLIKIVDEIYALGDEDTTMIFGTIEHKTFKINQMKLTLIINTVEFD